MNLETENDRPYSDQQLEQLWLSSVRLLNDEAEPEISEALMQRVKAAVENERRSRRVRRIRFPVIASSVAAAALVALLVVPQLFALFGQKNTSRMLPRDAAPALTRQAETVLDTEAVKQEAAMPDESMADEGPAIAEERMADMAAEEAVPEAAAPFAAEAPMEMRLDSEADFRLTLSDGRVLLLTRLDPDTNESATKSVAGSDIRQYLPEHAAEAKRFVDSLESSGQAEVWRFMKDAFADGDAVLVIIE